jgi:hypothetical protein
MGLWIIAAALIAGGAVARMKRSWWPMLLEVAWGASPTSGRTGDAVAVLAAATA